MKINMRLMVCAVSLLMIFVFGCADQTEIAREERKIGSMKQEIKQLEEGNRNMRAEIQTLVELQKEDDIISEKIRIVSDELDYSITLKEFYEKIDLLERYNIEYENIILRTENLVSDKKSRLDNNIKKAVLQYIETARKAITSNKNLIKTIRESREKNKF